MNELLEMKNANFTTHSKSNTSFVYVHILLLYEQLLFYYIFFLFLLSIYLLIYYILVGKGVYNLNVHTLFSSHIVFYFPSRSDPMYALSFKVIFILFFFLLIYLLFLLFDFSSKLWVLMCENHFRRLSLHFYGAFGGFWRKNCDISCWTYVFKW